MIKYLTFVASTVAVAGLVKEGIDARAADPFSLSVQSIVLTFLLSIILFAVNLKSFRRIESNIGVFDFDKIALGGQVYRIHDRSRDIIKALSVRHIDPPRD
jgi:hypothetical protein